MKPTDENYNKNINKILKKPKQQQQQNNKQIKTCFTFWDFRTC
jgi:hypothetical protein